MPATTGDDHTYKILELVGSSDESIEGAIRNAISRASKTIREMKWFEVVQTRGHIENGAVRSLPGHVACRIHAGGLTWLSGERVVVRSPRKIGRMPAAPIGGGPIPSVSFLHGPAPLSFMDFFQHSEIF